MDEEKMVQLMKALIEEKIELIQQMILKHPEFDGANKLELADLIALNEAIIGAKPIGEEVMMYQ